MRSRSTTASLATSVVLALALSGCGLIPGGGDTVGVAMPTRSSERWISDGETVQDILEEAGYSVDLQYAGDRGGDRIQAQQIEEMIDADVEVIIVAAVDGGGLGEQVEAARAKGIPVIAYDRLLRDTEDLEYYVTFDNYQVGVEQANALLLGLGLIDENGERTDDRGPYNIELFAGSLDDNNAHIFYEGAMDTLAPFLADRSLRVPSGQTDIVEVETYRWLEANGQARMESLLFTSYLDDTELHGVLSPYDGVSRGIITALTLFGMGPTLEEGMPIVTGQDAEPASVRLVSDGIQQSTVFKDTRELAGLAAEVTLAYLEDGTLPEADTTYDNGVIDVDTRLLGVNTVMADTIQQILVDSGYYTPEQIAAG